jgi:cell division septal protein FtsQ
MSFLVLLGVGTMFYLAGMDMAYYVTDVRVDGASTIAHQTVVEASGLKGMHMFWLSPARAADRVASVSNVLTATVEIALPNQAHITIAERNPVMAWDQAGERLWVDADGRLMQMRQESAGRLVILSQEPEKLQIGDRVPPEVLASALLLRQERPNIESLYYDLDNGLSYQDGRHWRAYFGVSLDVAQKLAVYEAVVADLQSRGLQPRYVSVINKDKPYYSLAEPAE